MGQGGRSSGFLCGQEVVGTRSARPGRGAPESRSRPRLPGPSGGEGGHLQGDPLPQLLGLLASLQVLQHVVELHHPHRRQAEGAASAADDVDKVVVVGRGQVDEPVVDVLWRRRSRRQLPVSLARRPACHKLTCR